jgi:hydrogenase maturation protein HypF
MDKLAEPDYYVDHYSLSGNVQGVGLRPALYRLATQNALDGSVLNHGGIVRLIVAGSWQALEHFGHRLPDSLPPAAKLRDLTVTRYSLQRFTETFAENSSLKDMGFQILPGEKLPDAPGKDSPGSPPATTCQADSHFTGLHRFGPHLAGLHMAGPDLAICDECLYELFEPGNRRQDYPFMQCTNCGPRFTQVRKLPYERSQTSLQGFSICAACATEFNNPNDRRFHAENQCCPDCGPRYWLEENNTLSQDVQWSLQDSVWSNQDGRKLHQDAMWPRLITLIRQGAIIAVQGIGGFHLLCDAYNGEAVDKLRERKRRPTKPFAVMLLNTATVWKVAGEPCNDAHRTLFEQALRQTARPVVLIPLLNSLHRADAAADNCAWLESLAPAADHLGVILPYSGFHYRLFHELNRQPTGSTWMTTADPNALLCTSANLSGSPLLFEQAEARQELRGLADAFVMHDRPILFPCDDSVIKPTASVPLIRPGRGLTPLHLALPSAGPSILALGAFLKTTVCITQDKNAFLSAYVGDLDHPDTCKRLNNTVRHFLQTTGIRPQAIACDLSRDGYGRRLAEQLSAELGVPLIEVQHHHAHLASVLAEAPALLGQKAIGVALDGHGEGFGDEAWGGEIFVTEATASNRLAQLSRLPLPGGECAIRDIRRLALGFAAQHQLPVLADTLDVPPALRQLIFSQTAESWPQSSSCGRWFDTAAALTGVLTQVTYEGEAAIRLETLASCYRQQVNQPLQAWLQEYRAILHPDGNLDPAPIVANLQRLNTPVEAAFAFHEALTEGLARWIGHHARQQGLQQIILSGGCLINQWLSVDLVEQLRQQGLSCYLNRQLPCNDSGISVGQAWAAMQRL